MTRFFDGFLISAMVRPITPRSITPRPIAPRLTAARLLIATGFGLSLGITEAAIAQPAVMQIPVPAPQARRTAVGTDRAEAAQDRPAAEARVEMTLGGEPLAMPGETAPVGNWAGRAGVKAIAAAQMPWMDGTPYAAVAPWGQAQSLQIQYRVVVATPGPAYAQALKRIVPEAIALKASSGTAQSKSMMQAGAFVDWRRANALRRALQAYGFLAEVQGL